VLARATRWTAIPRRNPHSNARIPRTVAIPRR
jgi:hypothetical protein